MSAPSRFSFVLAPALLLSTLVACGGPLEGETLEPEQVPAEVGGTDAAEPLGELRSELSASGTVTAGRCSTTSTLVRSGTSLVATCSARCEKESSITGRMRVNRLSSTGSVTLVGFNYFGAPARTGGSTQLTVQNMPTARYESRCEIDHADKNRWHTFGTVVAGPATF